MLRLLLPSSLSLTVVCLFVCAVSRQFVSPSTRRKLVMSVYGAPHDPLAAESIDASNSTLAILALDRDLGLIEQRDATRTALKWGTW